MFCAFAIRGLLTDPPTETDLDYELLQKQNAALSASIIAFLKKNPDFKALAKVETQAIIDRDNQDAEKLQQGIQFAIDKKVIPGHVDVEPISKIDVVGKSPQDVTRAILAKLGPAAHEGCIMTLQGLSGTGKGTTVAQLKETLPKAVTWSNGNMFRSLTLLCATYAEQHGCALQDTLTPELLARFTKMLSFGKFGPDGHFDTRINGLGIDTTVSQVQNTLLKSPKVSRNIPTVAAYTQGEVINFVQNCLDQMAAEGCTVLLEGREQTLNYIRTPHRFELHLSDHQIIGERRLAQRIGATALKNLNDKLAARPQKQGVPRHQVQRYVTESLYSILAESEQQNKQ